MTPPAPAAPTLHGINPTVDQALADTAVTSGAYLAGLIACAMLDTAGRPDKLPEYLFPDLDPADVRRVWQAALAVGLRAGRLSNSPRFHRDTLARLQALLADAGWTAMAHTAHHAARTAATEPEPDHERTPTSSDETRGGHW
ncbi:hypothetical protein [Streptomyces sp. NPDC058295]|uniref:hypothetical protein n=1 Tax=Streptomyces sp. NPDC058295 TaxID=3346431 RepID=UPI0036E838E1